MDSIFHPLGGQCALVDIYLLPYYLSDQEPQSGGESYARAVTFYSILYFSVHKCRISRHGFLCTPEGMNAEKRVLLFSHSSRVLVRRDFKSTVFLLTCSFNAASYLTVIPSHPLRLVL